MTGISSGDKGQRAMHLGQAIVVLVMAASIALDWAYDPPERVRLPMYVFLIGLAVAIGILTDVVLPYRRSLYKGRATARDRKI